AAALYGVGARLDLQPELLFRLRKADPADLVTAAGRGLVASLPAARGHEVLAGDDLGAVFGIELETAGPGPLAAAAKPALAGRRSKVAAPRAASPRVPKKPVAAPAKSPVPLSPLPKLRGFTPRVLTRVELSSLGASAATVREWLAAGYLIGTDRNATYYTTPRLGMELERLQARGKKGRRRCLRRKRPRERPSLAPIEGTSAPRGR
ncbi:MAG: hypothetical protein HY303_15060, partial [Candidatus Wallbacteria bacterium]|nr:hypothetical protein [Candidatus Wallbacteria bacterium]